MLSFPDDLYRVAFVPFVNIVIDHILERNVNLFEILLFLFFLAGPSTCEIKVARSGKNEDIALVKSDVYVTFDQCNVFFFSLRETFYESEKQAFDFFLVFGFNTSLVLRRLISTEQKKSRGWEKKDIAVEIDVNIHFNQCHVFFSTFPAFYGSKSTLTNTSRYLRGLFPHRVSQLTAIV